MIQLGMQLPRLVLRWASDAEQVFSLQFKDGDNVPLDLTGATVRLKFSDGTILNGVNSVGGFVTWTLSEAQSDPAFIGRSVRLEYLQGGNTYLWAQGEVRAA